MFRLDRKLSNIRQGRYRPEDFIIADAKDSDMSTGIPGTGFDRTGGVPRRRSRQEFVSEIERIIKQDVVDIMLVSASNLELLDERSAFSGTGVKPAIRTNSSTDTWGTIRNSTYASVPSRPFRSTNLARTKGGAASCRPDGSAGGTDLGLYSITFNNDVASDAASMEQFDIFVRDASAHGFKYFLEVFNPNVDIGLAPEEIGDFVNDSILRLLAGTVRIDRPQFLKMTYNGPRALEDLASFDSELVVGVLGGGAGTTRDTLELLSQAERYGARIALFGRKINLAEDSLALISIMREIAERRVGSLEGVRAYHDQLEKKGLTPIRSLDEDCSITQEILRSGQVQRAR